MREINIIKGKSWNKLVQAYFICQFYIKYTFLEICDRQECL